MDDVLPIETTPNDSAQSTTYRPPGPTQKKHRPARNPPAEM